jgi:C-terminal processing protease CtpA/Prc
MRWGALVVLLCLGLGSAAPAQQGLGTFDRDNSRAMLRDMKDDIKNNYYDPTFRGINLDEHFKQADERLKQATTRDQLMIIIAQALLDFNDSHLFFQPPPRAADIEYGWQMQMVGGACYIIAVKPKSDAEAKGLKPGDIVLAVDGFRPARDNLWKMYYRYYALMPARSVRLVVQSPGEAKPRELDVVSKITKRPAALQWDQYFFRLLREDAFDPKVKYYEIGKDAFIWKMKSFEVDENHIDSMMGRAKKFKTLILDLRGNGGGYQDMLKRLAGYFFDHDVTIATDKRRKESKPLIAKTRGGDMFKGRLIVLVDSESASAAEMFARLVQLEKLGTVLGDKTMGAVMTARGFDHQTGNGDVTVYGASITVGDVVMSDGKSLENVGVTPNEMLLPTGADLAAKRDPALARATELAGVPIDAEKAGTLFPYEWSR